MQTIRLYFPSFQATQLVCGVDTSYSKEIKKLRNFGMQHVLPYLKLKKYLKYPYKITITFLSFSDQDAISTLTIAAFLLHLFESTATLQSTDYRILPSIEVKMKKVFRKEDEGCEIIIEELPVK